MRSTFMPVVHWPAEDSTPTLDDLVRFADELTGIRSRAVEAEGEPKPDLLVDYFHLNRALHETYGFLGDILSTVFCTDEIDSLFDSIYGEDWYESDQWLDLVEAAQS